MQNLCQSENSPITPKVGDKHRDVRRMIAWVLLPITACVGFRLPWSAGPALRLGSGDGIQCVGVWLLGVGGRGVTRATATPNREKQEAGHQT